ncbi:hypothetical protein D3C75_1160130 [compost metagenome]
MVRRIMWILLRKLSLFGRSRPHSKPSSSRRWTTWGLLRINNSSSFMLVGLSFKGTPARETSRVSRSYLRSPTSRMQPPLRARLPATAVIRASNSDMANGLVM